MLEKAPRRLPSIPSVWAGGKKKNSGSPGYLARILKMHQHIVKSDNTVGGFFREADNHFYLGEWKLKGAIVCLKCTDWKCRAYCVMLSCEAPNSVHLIKRADLSPAS